MGSGALPQRKDILQTGLRAGHSKASRADLNFTNALREGLFLLALARAAPIARRLVAPPACSAFNVGLTSAALALARWNPECRYVEWNGLSVRASQLLSLTRSGRTLNRIISPRGYFGLADWSSQSERGDVSTFHKAQKYSRAPPKQSSTSSPPNSATRTTSLLRAVQTFQPATQVQRLALCPNQGWPKHRPNKLANTHQNPAFAQLSIGGAPRRLCVPGRRCRQADFIASTCLALGAEAI